ncbi:MAG: NhaA family Na+:H+ antiporter [Bacteroidia bacterium]|jgi:NhaA family Na+:H+ antiporter
MATKQSKSEATGIAALFQHEASAGVLLMFATLMALIVSNTGAAWYPALLDTPAKVLIGDFVILKPLLLWINDGLMAIFFLLVGLELKREVLYGELSEWKKITLPLAAAFGGLVVPAAIYYLLNKDNAAALNGWAIPAATDIAFALGILALLGSRVPVALKILLTSIAVIDDLAAIVIIAIFYTSQLSVTALTVSGVTMVVLFLMNRFGVKSIAPYLLVGLVLWASVLKSGVHATLAGVALAAFIPARPNGENAAAEQIEHFLHSWVAFFILPVFAFANAGVPLAGISLEALLRPIPLGIGLGLFLGKQVGVFGLCYVTIKSGWAKVPKGVSWAQLYGLGCLCGVGFTMSLFIASLAFEGSGAPVFNADARLGILAGSILSGITGFIVLLKSSKAKGPANDLVLDSTKDLAVD